MTSLSATQPPATATNAPLSSKRMVLGLVPWLLFSVILHRLGASAAPEAALAAAVLGAVLALREGRSQIKIIDVTGIVLFTAMAAAALGGGPAVSGWLADFGRGVAAIILGAVMLLSVALVPFSEQYARESVPREFWTAPAFRAVNRRVSAIWGVAVLVMGAGHLLAGLVDPVSVSAAGPSLVSLTLNWGVPVLLVTAAVQLSGRVVDQAG